MLRLLLASATRQLKTARPKRLKTSDGAPAWRTTPAGSGIAMRFHVAPPSCDTHTASCTGPVRSLALARRLFGFVGLTVMAVSDWGPVSLLTLTFVPTTGVVDATLTR